MDWIPALLKHLAISRSVVGAVFITSLVLYVGPRALPTYVEAVPREWAAVVVGAMVFSGTLLCFWGSSAVWAATRRRWSESSAMLASFDLKPLEAEILVNLGANPTEPLNLGNVDYEALSLSRLEVLELMHGLSRKGLVSVNTLRGNFVSLTPLGRQRALDIERSQRGTVSVI
jgi:hypothetical protein